MPQPERCFESQSDFTDSSYSTHVVGRIWIRSFCESVIAKDLICINFFFAIGSRDIDKVTLVSLEIVISAILRLINGISPEDIYRLAVVELLLLSTCI